MGQHGSRRGLGAVVLDHPLRPDGSVPDSLIRCSESHDRDSPNPLFVFSFLAVKTILFDPFRRGEG